MLVLKKNLNLIKYIGKYSFGIKSKLFLMISFNRSLRLKSIFTSIASSTSILLDRSISNITTLYINDGSKLLLINSKSRSKFLRLNRDINIDILYNSKLTSYIFNSKLFYFKNRCLPYYRENKFTLDINTHGNKGGLSSSTYFFNYKVDFTNGKVIIPIGSDDTSSPILKSNIDRCLLHFSKYKPKNMRVGNFIKSYSIISSNNFITQVV